MKTQLTFEQIKFLIDNNRDVSIETPTNYSKIKSAFTKKLGGYNIILDDGTSIKCAKTHNMLCHGDWKTSDEMIVGDRLTDKYGNPTKTITQIREVPSQEWIDFEVDNEFECYIQNDVLHHNSGKSFIIFLFVRFMLQNKKNALIVVPSVGLVTQMAQDFEDYGWTDVKDFMKQIGGEFKGSKDLSEKPIVLSTWQSLQYMKKEEFDIFECIVVDEGHKVRGDVLKTITDNAVNASWKIGMTGTIPKARVDKLQLLGTLGPVKHVINAKGLIDRGLATDVDINCIFIKHSVSAVDAFYKNHKNKPKYPDEEKYLGSDPLRNDKVSKILINIAKRGNTIGLFTKTAHGELILKNVIKYRTGNANFDLLHKFTPKPLKEAYTEFQKDPQKLFYVNKKIELVDRKKLINNMSKIALDEKDRDAFIANVKSLDDLNIFFYNGAVDAITREYIRQKLEIIETEHENINLFFGNIKITIREDCEVPLTDGTFKLAKDITEDDDVLDSWIEEYK